MYNNVYIHVHVRVHNRLFTLMCRTQSTLDKMHHQYTCNIIYVHATSLSARDNVLRRRPKYTIHTYIEIMRNAC